MRANLLSQSSFLMQNNFVESLNLEWTMGSNFTAYKHVTAVYCVYLSRPKFGNKIGGMSVFLCMCILKTDCCIVSKLIASIRLGRLLCFVYHRKFVAKLC